MFTRCVITFLTPFKPVVTAEIFALNRHPVASLVSSV